ncbi:cellular retinoic acid-binding protein 1a [Amia ocellicauda]|uniref:cellular retinoic acid-binding protein 1a n=1 Tax=Amia ocellicauda TaxID=2972642 RepID=UPI00346490A3
MRQKQRERERERERGVSERERKEQRAEHQALRSRFFLSHYKTLRPDSSFTAPTQPSAATEMPNFAGTWKMKSSENFDELLKALGVNAMLRKVAGAAASKPHVEIRQNGEQFYIKTSTTVRTTEINFHIGEEFEEETVDGRKCRSLATWETENKMYCKQTLVGGTGPKTYWTRELRGDELILTFGADDVVCTRIYVRE